MTLLSYWSRAIGEERFYDPFWWVERRSDYRWEILKKQVIDDCAALRRRTLERLDGLNHQARG